jgi:hypothetical protein
MSAVEQARFEGMAEGEAKGRNEMLNVFRKLGVSPEILEKASGEIEKIANRE